MICPIRSLTSLSRISLANLRSEVSLIMNSESMEEEAKTIWHPGPPSEAIQLAISQQKLFLVWIQKTESEESSDPNAASWDSLWTDDKIKPLLEEYMVSLKLEKTTSDAEMFLQSINHPTDSVGVWVIFAGRLLLSFTEPPSIDDMQTQLQSTVSQIETFKQQFQAQVQEQTQAQRSEHAPQPYSSSSSSSTTDAPTQDIQSQLAARRLAQEQRKQAHDRQQKESLRKAARRQSSSLDPERQKYITQQARERALQREEKRKILEEIENDKAERRARTERAHLEQQVHEQRVQGQGQRNASVATGNGMTKVSIRQPDSVVLKHEFASSETLSDVRKWIDSNRSDGSAPYVLQTTFPTRSFEVSEEHSETLQSVLGKGGQLIMKVLRLLTALT